MFILRRVIQKGFLQLLVKNYEALKRNLFSEKVNII